MQRIPSKVKSSVILDGMLADPNKPYHLIKSFESDDKNTIDVEYATQGDWPNRYIRIYTAIVDGVDKPVMAVEHSTDMCGNRVLITRTELFPNFNYAMKYVSGRKITPKGKRKPQTIYIGMNVSELNTYFEEHKSKYADWELECNEVDENV